MGKSLICCNKIKVSCNSALYKPMGKSLTCKRKKPMFLANRSCINQWGKSLTYKKKFLVTQPCIKPMGKSLTCEKKFLANYRPCINQLENH